MKLDTISHQRQDDKPAVIFIHGLGMDKDIWVNPGSSRILGGMFPLSILISRNEGEQSEDIQTLFDDLKLRDYSVITWSQKRPAGPIDSAVPELREIVRMARKVTKSGIILVGHSRGGLVARKYLTEKDKSVRGLITICTPHDGSSVARIAKYVSPLVSVVAPFIPSGEKGSLSFAVKRISEFLKSRSLKELLPGSNFFTSLHDKPLDGVYYGSLGGTNPTLFSIYDFSFPDVLEGVMPENFYPEEMKKNRGDGLVSAESSRMPWSHEHYNFAFNHAEILFNKDVRNILCDIIGRIAENL